jgi:hypothetical protein
MRPSKPKQPGTKSSQRNIMSAARNKKIHVLYLVSRMRQHGPIFQLYNTIKYLDRAKFHPRLITLSPEASDSLLPAFERVNVECCSLGLSRMAGMVLGPGRIRRLLRENPVDLIHTSDFRSVLLCAMNFTGIPRVVTCRAPRRDKPGICSRDSKSS